MVLFYKCNVKRVTFIKRFGRIYSEESQMELISFRIILIFIGKISKFCRERREYIFERKQIERLAQSFEKIVQMAMKDTEGIS